LVYSLHEDDDEGCAGGGLMIEMLKQGADETTTMANPEAEDKKAAARVHTHGAHTRGAGSPH
jgi:hypothetical protein